MTADAEYTRLRKEYSKQLWGSRSTRPDVAARLAAQEAKVLKAALRESCRTARGDEEELARFLEFEELKLEYFERSLAFGFDRDAAGPAREDTEPRLREFCLATGGELRPLDDFFRDVEMEIISYLAV